MRAAPGKALPVQLLKREGLPATLPPLLLLLLLLLLLQLLLLLLLLLLLPLLRDGRSATSTPLALLLLLPLLLPPSSLAGARGGHCASPSPQLTPQALACLSTSQEASSSTVKGL